MAILGTTWPRRALGTCRVGSCYVRALRHESALIHIFANCNIDLILVLFLLLPSLLTNVVYVKKQLCYLLFVIGWLVAGLIVTERLDGLRCRLAKILEDRKFSLEISGPKMVLLCKFSLYRAARDPIRPGPWGFSLTSLMDDPAVGTCLPRLLDKPTLNLTIVYRYEPRVAWLSTADCSTEAADVIRVSWRRSVQSLELTSWQSSPSPLDSNSRWRVYNGHVTTLRLAIASVDFLYVAQDIYRVRTTKTPLQNLAAPCIPLLLSSCT